MAQSARWRSWRWSSMLGRDGRGASNRPSLYCGLAADLSLILGRFHSENGILTTIVRRLPAVTAPLTFSSSSQFTLVFWDIIFAPVNGVFETKYQSAPLDLSTDAFAVGLSCLLSLLLSV